MALLPLRLPAHAKATGARRRQIREQHHRVVRVLQHAVAVELLARVEGEAPLAQRMLVARVAVDEWARRRRGAAGGIVRRSVERRGTIITIVRRAQTLRRARRGQVSHRFERADRTLAPIARGPTELPTVTGAIHVATLLVVVAATRICEYAVIVERRAQQPRRKAPRYIRRWCGGVE